MATSKSITSLTSLIRLPNIILVAIVQYVIYYVHLLPEIIKNGLTQSTSDLNVSLFILCTSLVVAAGNVINDIADQSIDAINKPCSRTIGRMISEQEAIFIFLSLVSVGGVVALYLAYSESRMLWFFIYPLSIILLVLYSRFFKCIPILGNIIIAVFCSSIFLVILLLEWDALLHVLTSQIPFGQFWEVIIAFIWFSFIITWTREMTKDLEDIQGDEDCGCRTIAVRLGIKKSGYFVITLLSLVLISVFVWMWYRRDIFDFSFSTLFFVLPLAIMTTILFRHSSQDTYKKISSHLKILMAFAIIYLIFV